ncbi:MAG: (d)CMP kinase, partial [Dehalococcoidia bacterium]
RRDHLDSTRAVAPLRAADDAVRLLTDGQTLDEVIGQVLDLVKRRSRDARGSI